MRLARFPEFVQHLFGWARKPLSCSQFLHLRIFLAGVLLAGESRLLDTHEVPAICLMAIRVIGLNFLQAGFRTTMK